MRRWISCIAVSLSLLSGTAIAADQSTHEAADRWVQIIDQGDFAKSWKEADAGFQANVSELQWTQTLQQIHAQTGKMLKREFKTEDIKSDLPGAPAGKYKIVVYQTAFEKAPQVKETVVLTETKDGSWKVTGYFLQ
ncbi:DUF4019 domain-containing protein [Undibacterium squillarum]|uniref:DUF4019 domain-containing protein n=1 Tax=Undibacterium squillarum TaxID=1131567 RepID=A0ABQ2XS22_9BURK|nr:DUF4019 domain-containing protein [Undibacterium squillarum]GGX30419.1 hypothetical protein GCM10010946_04280 [Undibacterium squillarum]